MDQGFEGQKAMARKTMLSFSYFVLVVQTMEAASYCVFSSLFLVFKLLRFSSLFYCSKIIVLLLDSIGYGTQEEKESPPGHC